MKGSSFCRRWLNPMLLLLLLVSVQRTESWNSFLCSTSSRFASPVTMRHITVVAATKSVGTPSIEAELCKKRGFRHVIGADEAGRGCIAGPVVVASCCLLLPLPQDSIRGVDDSKNLSEQERNRIYEELTSRPDLYAWNVSLVDAQEVDRSNILLATMDGFAKSIESLVQTHGLPCSTTYGIVDGKKSPKLSIPVSCRPWVKADSQVYTVALASVVAKVTRDAIMKEYDAQYPEYGFADNKGYPTRDHVQAIHMHGACPLHRMSFKPLRGRSVTTRRSLLGTVLLATIGSHLSQAPASAMTTDTRTGISFPDEGEIEEAVPKDWKDVENPFQGSPRQFARLDSSPDALFYTEPRFVEHVDDNAVQLLTNYLSETVVRDNDLVLDLCSSWTSHVDSISVRRTKRIAGLGMNEKELASNPTLSDWMVQDLNKNPILPYDDHSFSVVLCQLSIDYLTRPMDVLKEVGRVLQPGGTVHILFSNRLFLSKAVALWTGADDIDHAYTVACYLHFSNGNFDRIQARDLSTRQGRSKRIVGDPLYVVTATKSKSS